LKRTSVFAASDEQKRDRKDGHWIAIIANQINTRSPGLIKVPEQPDPPSSSHSTHLKWGLGSGEYHGSARSGGSSVKRVCHKFGGTMSEISDFKGFWWEEEAWILSYGGKLEIHEKARRISIKGKFMRIIIGH
jgi:hypothetical protein